MADFKTMVARLQDNDKTAIYINPIKGFKGTKNNDELTLITEKGWGQKVVMGKSIAFLIIIDRDEFERLNTEPTEQPQTI